MIYLLYDINAASKWWPEVGRVPKNCPQVKVKVLLEIFTQVKVIVWIVTWVKVKKYRIKKLLK